MTAVREIWGADSDFCPCCGAILDLSKAFNFVECVVCKFKVDMSDIINQEKAYTVHFQSVEKQQKKKEEEEDGTELGQMDNDRECGKCGNIGMAYTTMQLRSADEGQTIFYICPKCKNREVENS